MVGLFLLNYGTYRTKNNGYTYKDLRGRNVVIEDEEIYEFMNYALFGAENIETDSMEFMKINCFSLRQGSNIESFIKAINDSLISRDDRKYMRNQ